MLQPTTTVVLLKRNTWAYKQAQAKACPETPATGFQGERIGAFFEVDTEAYENGQIEPPKQA